MVNTKENTIKRTETPANIITVNIAALEFSGAIQQNLLGAFDIMMADLAKVSNVNQIYQVFSPARGAKMLFSQRSDCLIPSSLHPPYFTGLNVIHSESFAQVNYLAFTAPNQKTIHTKDELTTKTIGVIRDEGTWNYVKRFNIKGAKYIQVSNLASLVEMLNHGRIDVAIHDHGDFINMTEHLKYPQANYDIGAPMAVDRLVITCHDNENNRAYLKSISPVLNHIIDNNKMSYYFQKSSIN